MKALAIYASQNTTKPDATGAFIPESLHWQRMHGGAREGYKNKLGAVACRREVEGILAKHSGIDALAFFNHGYRDGMQTGHHIPHVGALADAIAKACAPRVVIYLAACSTAKQRTVALGGFADALRDALTARGVAGHIDAHTTAGHTTRNPHVQRFAMGAPVGDIAGDWIVAPGDPLWRKWVAALKGDLRLRYPLMTREEIRASL